MRSFSLSLRIPRPRSRPQSYPMLDRRRGPAAAARAYIMAVAEAPWLAMDPVFLGGDSRVNSPAFCRVDFCPGQRRSIANGQPVPAHELNRTWIGTCMELFIPAILAVCGA